MSNIFENFKKHEIKEDEVKKTELYAMVNKNTQPKAQISKIMELDDSIKKVKKEIQDIQNNAEYLNEDDTDHTFYRKIGELNEKENSVTKAEKDKYWLIKGN